MSYCPLPTKHGNNTCATWDDLRESVRNAVYEQKDPILIYKFEAYDLFEAMLGRVNYDEVGFLFRAGIPVQDPNRVEQVQRQKRVAGKESRGAEENAAAGEGMPNRIEEPEKPRTYVRDQPQDRPQRPGEDTEHKQRGGA